MFVVTYNGVLHPCDGTHEAAATMVKCWLEDGPDPDIRVDKLEGDKLVSISQFERARIVASVSMIGALK